MSLSHTWYHIRALAGSKYDLGSAKFEITILFLLSSGLVSEKIHRWDFATHLDITEKKSAIRGTRAS